MKDIAQLTHEDVLKAAKAFTDFRPSKWTVIVGGIEFPARPLVREAIGTNPMDAANSHQSVRRLRNLGFDVRYQGTPQGLPTGPAVSGEPKLSAAQAIEDMKALRSELKLGPFDFAEFKKDRDEGRA